MDLKKLWDEANQHLGKPDDLAVVNLDIPSSQNILNILRKRLFAKLLYVIAFFAASLVLLWYVRHNDGAFIVSMLIFMYLMANLVMLWIQYRKLKPGELSFAKNPKDFLYQFHKKVKETLDLEHLMGNSFMFLAPGCGFMLSFFLQGHTWGEFISSPKYYLSLIGVSAVVVPLGIWASKKMNEYAFGKYLDQLEKIIDALSEP